MNSTEVHTFNLNELLNWKRIRLQFIAPQSTSKMAGSNIYSLTLAMFERVYF